MVASVSQHGLRRTADVRVAQTEDDVTDECNCAASLYFDASVDSCVSHARAQPSLARSTFSLHVYKFTFQLITSATEVMFCIYLSVCQQENSKS